MWLLQTWFSGGLGRFMAFPCSQWGIDHSNSQGLGSCSSVFTVLLYTVEQQVHFQSPYVDSDVAHTDAENPKNSWIYCAEVLKKTYSLCDSTISLPGALPCNISLLDT